MAHFAKVENSIVTEVIVAEQDFIDSLSDSEKYIQTSYNTNGGVNLVSGVQMRKNYAGVGYQYDSVRDAFIPTQPFPSWILNEETCIWEAPVLRPETKDIYVWNEDSISWEFSISFEELIKQN